ncbi:MAG: DNA replication and repair protein RecF [Clostridia bacterium]|nr:DNA replication and repair protein RecF [Clostridia bacterium]
MYVQQHAAERFRNLAAVRMTPDPEMNVIFGKNGQGKTNLIESLWMLTGFYSFRSHKNAHLVADGAKEAVITDQFFSAGRGQTVEMRIHARKEITLNGVKEASPRAMMGRFPAVVFSPQTLSVVQDGPAERRRLMDIALSLMKPNYALLYSNYKRALDQRNALLKKIVERKFDAAMMAPWDAELVKLGTRIIQYRLQYLEKLNAAATEIYRGISGGNETFSFYYDFQRETADETAILEKLMASLDRSREADLKRLYTNVGPHADDLVLQLDGRDARIYGSQGQQRSCALALKLGEASVIRDVTGECPIVLLTT